MTDDRTRDPRYREGWLFEPDDVDEDAVRELGGDPETVVRRGMEAVERMRRELAEEKRPAPAGPAGPRPTGSPRPAPSPERHLGRWLRLWTPLRASLAVNLVLIGALLIAQTNVFEPFVARIEVNDRVVSLFDARERGDRKELAAKWTHEFEGPVVQVEVAPWGREDRWVVVSFVDEPAGVARLEVWDFKKKPREPEWTVTVEPSEIASLFGEETSRRGTMKCVDFDFADVDGDGEAELATIFRHTVFYPACVRTVRRDGTVLGTYWNPGYLEDVLACDVDDDGRDEIVACGTNNMRSYQGGTVILLGEGHLSGGAVDAEGWSQPLLRDDSLVRVVLPMWDRRLANLVPMDRIHAYRLAVQRLPDGIAIRCNLGRSGDSPTPVAIGYFDGTLRPERIVFTDGFLTRAHLWVEEGQLEPGFLSDEWVTSWFARCPRFGALAGPEPVS